MSNMEKVLCQDCIRSGHLYVCHNPKCKNFVPRKAGEPEIQFTEHLLSKGESKHEKN